MTAAEMMKCPKVLAYLDQLAAQIVKDGFSEGDDIGAAAEAAHIKRRKFASEMLNQNTRRARIVKQALAVPVFAAANISLFKEELLSDEPKLLSLI